MYKNKLHFFPAKRCGCTLLAKHEIHRIVHNLQVCAALRKMSSVLRLGVYRERIEKYGGSGGNRAPLSAGSGLAGGAPTTASEEVLTVTLERQPGLHLGIR